MTNIPVQQDDAGCPNCGSPAPNHNFGCFRAPPKPAPDAMRTLLERALPIMEAAADARSVQIASASLARDIRAILSAPVPPADGIIEATQQQHVGRPKGEPAKFMRNGKLETCRCFDCRALSPSPAVAAERSE